MINKVTWDHSLCAWETWSKKIILLASYNVKKLESKTIPVNRILYIFKEETRTI